MSVTNKSETSTSNCCLDQHIVAKGGSGATCIFGGVADGVQYGVLATDYLLCKLLSSQRYNRVICICLDRRSDNIIATADRYIEQLEVSYVEYLRPRYALQNKYHILIVRNLSWAHMFSYLNRCTNYLYNLCNCDKQIQELDSKNVRDKLRTIDGTVSDSGDLKDILNAITHQITMDSIQYDVSRVSDDRGSSDRSARNAVEVRNNNDRGSRVKQSGSTAILIYSLSELILSVGVAKSIRFINEMKASSALITMQRSSSSCFNSSSSGGSSGVDGGEKTVLTSPSCGDDNNAATAPSVKLQTEEGGTPLSILALVHTSLHTSHTLSRLLPQPQSSNSMFSSTGSPFNASVIVKPNDGSLSARTFFFGILIIEFNHNSTCSSPVFSHDDIT